MNIKQRAILVYIKHTFDGNRSSSAEFVQLCQSTDLEYCFFCRLNLREINPKTFLSKGLLEYLKEVSQKLCPDVLVFSSELKAKHQRNLIKSIGGNTPIIDINELILDIFAQRANSHIGKIQVELAQLQHLSTRLVGGWTHLERQKGGIGLRGPGEKQLETDRRLLRDRITRTKAELKNLKAHRERNLNMRKKSNVFQVALVGYTNAGKSTLFNALTGSQTYTADQLFATLDPLVRKFKAEESYPICLSDTVGFMSQLPPVLIEAFQATLDELHYADIILHVIDGSDYERKRKEAAVNKTLQEMVLLDKNILTIYNKADAGKEGIITGEIWISSLDKKDIDKIRRMIIHSYQSTLPRQ